MSGERIQIRIADEARHRKIAAAINAIVREVLRSPDSALPQNVLKARATLIVECAPLIQQNGNGAS